MTRLVDILNRSWSWANIEFAEIAATSKMGHLIANDTGAVFWHIDPEMREVTRIGNQKDVILYLNQDETKEIWHAEANVDAAQQRLGDLAEGEVYSLNPLSLFAGDYRPENFCIIPLAELIALCGDMEGQIRQLSSPSTKET